MPPDGGLLRLGAANNLASDEDFLRCAVSAPASGYAWFGTSTLPGQVIKVAYDGPNRAPRRVASLILEPGEDSLFTGVIDVSAGYAYFGTFTSPGRVIKVSLGTGDAPPVRIGAVTLDAFEEQLFCSVIDPAAGYAYFGTRTAPGNVVKIALGTGNNPPTRVGAARLEFGEQFLRTAVIDPAAGYAWFGTFSNPGHVVKVALGAGAELPTRVAGLRLEFGENGLTAAVIDRAAGQAWFATRTTPGKVIKVDLGSGDASPTRLGTLTLEPGEDFLSCASLSAAAPGYALFGCDTFPGTVVKVALGAGMSAPTREAAFTLPAGEDSLQSAAELGGALLFGAFTQPGQVIQVGVGAAGQPPVREGALVLGRGENDLQSVVIDAANGYGWFGTATFPGQVIKVKLGRAGQPPQRIAAVTLEPGEDRLTSAVADVAGGYAWFGTDTDRGHVVKVALGNGDDPPTRIGAVTLNSDERALRCAVIDLANRYAYFGTAVFQSLGKVVKVALGDGNSPPTRVGVVALNADEWDFQSAVIDADGTYALFGTGQYFGETGAGGKVVKVALGAGNNPPTRVGVVALAAGEENLHSAVNDPLTGYAWFGGGRFGEEGRVIKVAFEPGNTPPRRVGAAILNTNEDRSNGAIIDTQAGYALFGGSRHVVKVALGNGEAPPVRVGGIQFPPNENSIHCGAGDPLSGLAWFGTSTQPGNVVLVSYSQKGFIKGTRIDLMESSTWARALASVHFYSHRATGNLRLALYARNGPNRDLVWQTGVIANAVNEGWIDVPVNQGTPPSLQLAAGTYDLAWQVDTTADVPSYLAGGAGDGFRVSADFGVFPPVLTEGANNWETTSEAWASYISYNVAAPRFIDIRVAGDTVTLVWTSIPGTSYQVQWRSDLVQGAWDDGPLVSATGATTEWSEPGVIGTSTRFYRLKVP